LLWLGQVSWLVPAALLVVAAWAIRRLRCDRARPEPAPGPAAPTAAEPAAGPSSAAAQPSCRPTLDKLSTAQLCTALRRSYQPNVCLPEVTDWTRVQIRGYLLDEIERRDPEGFARWMATTPQPGSDPSGYLSPGHRLEMAGQNRPWWW
jgi:hypothetical protein